MAIYNIEVSNNFSTRVSADTHVEAEIKARETVDNMLAQLRELSFTYSEPNEELLDSLRTITRGVSF